MIFKMTIEVTRQEDDPNRREISYTASTSPTEVHTGTETRACVSAWSDEEVLPAVLKAIEYTLNRVKGEFLE